VNPPTPSAPGVLIDLDAFTRRNEVLAYAQARGIGWREAIMELVNHALSTPAPTEESFQDKVDAGTLALMDAYPTLTEDFTPEWFRHAAEVVLLAGCTL
jgi:hypothetical protein